MKKSLLAYLLAASVTAGSLQAEEPFPIKFIALGGGSQTAQATESDDDDRLLRDTAAGTSSKNDSSASAYESDFRKIRRHFVPSSYAQASGLLMHRVGTGLDRVLVTGGGDSLLEPNVLDALTGGFQTTLGWQLFGSAHDAIELGYFGLYGWSENATFTDPGGSLTVTGFPGLTPVVFPNFSDAESVAVRYDSDLYNAEFNYVRSFYNRGAKIDFLSGFRYVHLDESLGIASDNTDTLLGTAIAPGEGTYDVNARNNLFGFQVGGRYSRPFGRWSLQTTGKAGIFLNDASTSQRLADTVDLLGPIPPGPVTTVINSSADDRSIAALGEVGIFGRRQLTDTWALRLGYQATGIGGVALAMNQATPFEPGTSSGIRSDGFFFMHGGVFGLEATW